jgi:RNA 2',3'-cyclic 3'-phosphodiesterase
VRLFVAVWPPDDLLDAVARLPRPERPGVRWTTRDQWHATLRFLGHVEMPDAALEALRRVDAPATEAVLGPAVEALNPRVLSIPVAGLDDVAMSVVACTAEVGKPPEDRPFRGHLTLARSKRGSVRRLAGAAVTGRWRVEEIALVRSDLSRSGARYETLATVPLR